MLGTKMPVVFLYGPPAAGKLTVAKELSALTSYKLFDNHVTIDWANQFFDFGTEPFWRLVERFRWSVFEEAVASGIGVISTFVYSEPRKGSVVQHGTTKLLDGICSMVSDAGSRVCLVRLTCSLTVLEARIEAPDRVARGKLASVEQLRTDMGRLELFGLLPKHESLTIDNTDMPPRQAALRIVEHYRLTPHEDVS
jgi:hypothetical protein